MASCALTRTTTMKKTTQSSKVHTYMHAHMHVTRETKHKNPDNEAIRAIIIINILH